MLYSRLLRSIPNLSSGFAILGKEKKEEKILCPNQVHGDSIYWLTEDSVKKNQEADAIATFQKNIAIGVQSADCCPILLCAINQDFHAIALMAIHAGWRGTAKKIAAKGFSLLHRESKKKGTLVAILVAIGPYISGPHFKVGEEVQNAFFRTNASMSPAKEKGKYHLDIGIANIRQITEATKHFPSLLMLETLGQCTYTSKTLPSKRKNPSSTQKIISYLRMHE